MTAAPAGLPNSVDILRTCSLFQELDENDCRKLAERAVRQSVSAGEMLFEVGDPGTSMMAVLDGLVRISLPSATGKEIILADLGPGEIFGEIALLDGRSRTASAVVRQPGTLLILERREVMDFLSTRPAFCMTIIALLCARLRTSDERMADIAFFDLPVRLAKAILKRQGKGSTPPVASQTDLAKMIGSSREHVNRCIKDWQRRGLVRTEGSRIVVLNAPALHAIAQDAEAG